jgi:hypothetical protein
MVAGGALRGDRPMAPAAWAPHGERCGRTAGRPRLGMAMERRRDVREYDDAIANLA